MSISPSTRKTIAKRANYLCEYCLSPQDFSTQSHSIEHILPKIKKGSDEPENLALACQGCNSHKSDKTEAIDPFTKRISPLYNPRTDIWKDHFTWSDDYLEIIGITAKGRATISLLKLNRQGVINLRTVLILYGQHPPK